MSGGLFDRVDEKRNGLLDAVELAEAFRDCEWTGCSVTLEACEEFLRRYAADGTHLTREEFSALWDQATRLYAKADSDGDGRVSVEDLLRESEGYDRVRAARMFELLDAADQGYVTFPEFFFGVDLRSATLKDALMRFSLSPSRSMLPWHPSENTNKVFLCGSVAGMVSKTAVAPISRLVLLQQLNPRPEVGSWTLLRQMRNTAGWLALFRGNMVSTFKVAPTAAVSMGTYMKLREHVDSPFVCGLMAGGLAALVMVPVENVRVHISKLVS
jgi:Ca2+-binding EF-hand superfamily protein